MDNKSFLLKVLKSLKQEENGNNWRGTITSWTKC